MFFSDRGTCDPNKNIPCEQQAKECPTRGLNTKIIWVQSICLYQIYLISLKLHAYVTRKITQGLAVMYNWYEIKDQSPRHLNSIKRNVVSNSKPTTMSTVVPSNVLTHLKLSNSNQDPMRKHTENEPSKRKTKLNDMSFLQFPWSVKQWEIQRSFQIVRFTHKLHYLICLVKVQACVTSFPKENRWQSPSPPKEMEICL